MHVSCFVPMCWLCVFIDFPTMFLRVRKCVLYIHVFITLSYHTISLLHVQSKAASNAKGCNEHEWYRYRKYATVLMLLGPPRWCSRASPNAPSAAPTHSASLAPAPAAGLGVASPAPPQVIYLIPGRWIVTRTRFGNPGARLPVIPGSWGPQGSRNTSEYTKIY